MSFAVKHKIGLLEESNICLKKEVIYRFRLYKNRAAIWRKDGGKLSWDELQDAKQCLIGDQVAIEVYPSKKDVVNKKNTRHLWFSKEISDIVKAKCIHPEFDNGGLI
ncbi:MAG TPA: hypothetical protein VMW44_00725 [Candidatus Bathyarchaeia archaeon]|nr:hypothetical protein [Candidatus Bathyarchaeia archaeon]